MDIFDYRIEHEEFYKHLREQQGDGFYYLAGPYSGPTRLHQKLNIQVMQAYHYVVTSMGLTAVAMPVLCRQYDHTDGLAGRPHRGWLEDCERIIRSSKGVLIMPRSDQSAGVKHELEFAKSLGVATYHLPDMNMVVLSLVMRGLEILQ